MRSLLLLLLVGCVESGSVQVGGDIDSALPDPPDPVGARAFDADRLQAILNDDVRASEGWGAALLSVAGPDGARFDGVSGDRTRDGEPAVLGDAFEVASVTKTFTAALILSLVREGRFELDDTLDEVLGGSTPPRLSDADGIDHTAEVTIRQLLQHTSGIPDYWTDPPYVAPGVNGFLAEFLRFERKRWTLPELLGHAANLDAPGLPGERWHYSDSNYVLLALVAETVLGTTYTAALRDRILAPHGLDQSWIFWEEPGPGVPLTARYEGRRDLTQWEHQSADIGGGGLASTTADLIRFAERLADGTIVGDRLLGEMLRTVETGAEGVGYGLGVTVVQLDDGTRLWGHDGYGGAFLYHWADRGLTWAGTINQTERSSEPLQGAVVTELYRWTQDGG
jgi:D-alanyl-D-alanine carboxypeptidase